MSKSGVSAGKSDFSKVVGYCFHIADLHGIRVGRLWDGSRREEVKYESKKFSRYEAGTFIIWFRLSIDRRGSNLMEHPVRLQLTVHEHGELVLEADAQTVGGVPSNVQMKTYLQKGEWEEAVQAHAYSCEHCRYSRLFEPPGPTGFQEKMEILMNSCIEFVLRNEKHPYLQEGFSTHRGWVEYRNGGLTVRCCIQTSLIGNGYCGATVHEDGKLVFHAEGGYRTSSHRVTETVYIPGTWERTISK